VKYFTSAFGMSVIGMSIGMSVNRHEHRHEYRHVGVSVIGMSAIGMKTHALGRISRYTIYGMHYRATTRYSGHAVKVFTLFLKVLSFDKRGT